MSDAELAARLAEAAGRMLLSLQATGLLSGRSLGAAGDRVANEVILTALRGERPDDGLLSEESRDDHGRLSRERVWIIDPLDGTREYSEGRDDWAVHVALAVGGRAAVGAVALPARGRVLRSDAMSAPAPGRSGRPRILVSRTRPPKECDIVAAALGGELVPMGSAGAKAMSVAMGEADIYIHSGGQYEWDNCAPAAVAMAAGLHVSRIDGAPLEYNSPDPLLPDLLICRPDLAAAVLDAVRKDRG